MADSLEDDFALSDVGSIQGEAVDERESDTEAMTTRKRHASEGNEGMEETEEEKRLRKKRKMKQQDKNRKAKVRGCLDLHLETEMFTFISRSLLIRKRRLCQEVGKLHFCRTICRQIICGSLSSHASNLAKCQTWNWMK